jgi:hypothetical protein
MYVYFYSSMYVCMHIYVHTHTHTYMYTYTHIITKPSPRRPSPHSRPTTAPEQTNKTYSRRGNSVYGNTLPGMLDVRIVSAEELVEALRLHRDWGGPRDTPRARNEEMATDNSAHAAVSVHSPRRSAATHAPANRDDAHLHGQANDCNNVTTYYPFKSPLKAVPSFAKSASSQVLSATSPYLLINMPTAPPVSVYDLQKPPAKHVPSPTAFTVSTASTRDTAMQHTQDRDNDARTYTRNGEKVAGSEEVQHVRHDEMPGARPKTAAATAAAYTRHDSMLMNQNSNAASFSPRPGSVVYYDAGGVSTKDLASQRAPAKSVYFQAPSASDASVHSAKERGSGHGYVSLEDLHGGRGSQSWSNMSRNHDNGLGVRVSSIPMDRSRVKAQYMQGASTWEGVPTVHLMSRRLALTVWTTCMCVCMFVCVYMYVCVCVCL